MQALSNIFWLGIKEIRSFLGDWLLVGLVIWAFSGAVFEQSKGLSDAVNNASVAIVDEDNSTLSRAIRTALYPPYFQEPELISADEIDAGMDHDRFMFVIVIPPDFERDVRAGNQPSYQINIDATAVAQASLGAEYITHIMMDEIAHYAQPGAGTAALPVTLVSRRAFNPNGTQRWFGAIIALVDQLSMLTLVLTGAALIREREHGTIEHLLVMPLTSVQIALAKVWANGLVILIAFTLSLLLMFQGVLEVPVAGSRGFLLFGTALYVVAAAAIGIFLATIARTMAQFALLMLMTMLPMMMLSGGMTPVESQPLAVQYLTYLMPSRHYVAFAQGVVFRGADFAILWPQVVAMIVLGGAFFAGALMLFRRSISASK
ncbi:MAG: ABC transporter permease [Neomegalonema sp.]|nr:ABC transporter permease [Neomegalonema sp.]